MTCAQAKARRTATRKDPRYTKQKSGDADKRAQKLQRKIAVEQNMKRKKQ